MKGSEEPQLLEEVKPGKTVYSALRNSHTLVLWPLSVFSEVAVRRNLASGSGCDVSAHLSAFFYFPEILGTEK